MNWQETPVYITNRDNLDRGFRQLIRWLYLQGMTNVNVIDNGSTHPGLLLYYAGLEVLGVKIQRNENLGPYAFWQLGLHGMQATRFIVTDPDVIPADGCPDDLIQRMHQAMDDHGAVKVGPSLRIDNLPDHYRHAQQVRDWEAQFWTRPLPDKSAYHAQIDTTFALYQPGSPHWPAGCYLRLAPPYTFEHVPWYDNSSQPNAERDYYLAHARHDWIHWSKEEVKL